MQRHLTHFIGVFSIIALVGAATGQPSQQWLAQFGTGGEDEAYAVAPDGAGGAFVAGITDGSLGGPNAGSTDVYVARFDGAGDQVWLKQFGSDAYDLPTALAQDGAGGAFIGGQTAGSLAGQNAGLDDPYLARYDRDGNQVWIIQFGTDGDDSIYALAPDGAGGVYAAGITFGNLGGPNAGGRDFFLARYDAAGKQEWITQNGTNAGDYAHGLAPDGAGGVLVVGTTDGSLGGPNAGSNDAWLARYSGEGDQAWLAQFGSSSNDSPYAIAPDGVGGAFIGGMSYGNLGGPNAGANDAFIARHDGAGNQAWLVQFGTEEYDDIRGLASDGAGGVLATGFTGGSLGGPNAGGYDAFLTRHNGAGNQTGIVQFGSDQTDIAYALAPDGSGGAFVAGFTDGSLGGPNAGGRDAFLARFGEAVCYPDCDRNGTLDLFDYLCFLNSFNAGC